MSKLIELEKRIDELEKLVNPPSSGLFGRIYHRVGSSHADFLIKTRGQVKILWGNKFIDLIKDGKLNVDFQYIYTVKLKEDIKGADGIYVTEDGCVYLKIGDNIINLAGEIGNTYVSFMAELETTGQLKETALKNIGFLYQSTSLVDENAIQNGIIYVTDDEKLYIVTNGQLQEFQLRIPNPLTEQLVISKNDSSVGSLVITGEGRENSLAFDCCYIYELGHNLVFDAEKGEICFKINGADKFRITPDSLVFVLPVTCNKFQSQGATDSYGFRLYMDGSESTLEVDHLIVRNPDDEVPNAMLPLYWFYKNNKVISAEYSEINEVEDEGSPQDLEEIVDGEDEEEGDELLPPTEEEKAEYANITYLLKLAFTNEFEPGSFLYMYCPYKDESDFYKWVLLPLKVLSEEEADPDVPDEEEVVEPEEAAEEADSDTDSDTEEEELDADHLEEEIPASEVYVTILVDKMTPEDFDMVGNMTEEELAQMMANQYIFLVAVADKQIPIIRAGNGNLDLIPAESIDDFLAPEKVNTRIGDLSELGLKFNDNDGEKDVSGFGIFTLYGLFKEAAYTSDYVLEPDDCSSRFASTEWVKENGSIEVDLTFNDVEVDPATYFTAEEIKKVIDEQEQSTCKTYLGKYGFITIDKTNSIVSVFARAKIEDEKWSYRALTVTLDTWEVLGNYLIDDCTGLEAIQVIDSQISLLLDTPESSETTIPVTFTQSETGLRGSVNKTDIQTIVDSSEEPAITAGDGLQLADNVMSVKIDEAAAPSDNTKVTLVANSSGLSGYVSNTDIQNIVDSVSTDYTLPAATSSILGGVKLASDTKSSVDTLNITTTNDRTYGVQVNNNGLLVVNVPWTDTATSGGYTLPEATADTLGGVKLASDTKSSVNSPTIYDTADRTYGVLVNNNGLLVVNVPWTDNATSGGGDYTLTAATSTTLGGVKLGSDEKLSLAAEIVTSTEKRTYAVQNNNNGQLVVNVPWEKPATVDTSSFVESMDTSQLKKILVVTALPEEQVDGVLYLVMS